MFPGDGVPGRLLQGHLLRQREGFYPVQHLLEHPAPVPSLTDGGILQVGADTYVNGGLTETNEIAPLFLWLADELAC